MPKQPNLKVKRIKPPFDTDDEAYLRLHMHSGLQTEGGFPRVCGPVQDAINGPVIPHNRGNHRRKRISY